jgi:hypothetical protein
MRTYHTVEQLYELVLKNPDAIDRVKVTSRRHEYNGDWSDPIDWLRVKIITKDRYKNLLWLVKLNHWELQQVMEDEESSDYSDANVCQVMTGYFENLAK